MQQSFISVPLPLHKFTQLIRFLDAKKSAKDPVVVISDAIDYWIENADWKGMDLLGEPTSATEAGYWWKSLFLPAGTKLRMAYKGTMYEAEVVENDVRYKNETVSPSEFTFRVTRTARNAWRDIELLFPGKSQWESAEMLRRQ